MMNAFGVIFGVEAVQGRVMEFRFDSQVIAVNRPTRAALLDDIANRLAQRVGFSLATLNLDHLVKLSRSEPFRRAYAEQDIVVADGHPVVWLSRLAGRHITLLPGSDLVVPLARLAAEAGVSVAFLGSTEDALERASEALTEQAPGLRVVARIAPPFGFDPESAEADRMLDEIGASGAGLCFIALGAPKQELLAARARMRLPEVGFASVGAGLDFLSGRQERAPLWMRQLALEWAWRMGSDPARLVPRYIACAAILPRQVIAALWQRGRRD